MNTLTFEQANELLKDIPVNPKSGRNAATGANYDYLYKTRDHYISHNECVHMLMGKRNNFTCLDEMISKLKLNKKDNK